MQDDNAPIRIKLRGFGFSEPSHAQRWVKAMYSKHPVNPMNNKQLTFVYTVDNAPVVTLVELRADQSNPQVAWIDWIQSTPRKTGAAARTIRAIQQSAAESGISLRLTASTQSDVSADTLEQIYNKLGFVKDNKGMLWTPDLSEAWSNKYKKSINCSNPKGFSQKAHCAARVKRRAGGKTTSKPVTESWLTAAQELEDYANTNIPQEDPAFGDFMYHAELIRKGHQDIHREDLPKVAIDYKDKLVDIINKHTTIEESTVVLEVITAYHGSPKRDIRSKRFWPLSHFGTEKAAQDRMKMYAKHKKVFGKNPDFDYRIYQVALDINNPAMIKDEDVSHDPTQFAFALHKAKIFSKLEMMTVTVWPTIKSTSNEDYDTANMEARKYSREKQKQVSTKQLIKLLKSKGYDGMVYKNKHEDKGSLSYVIFDPSQVRIVRSRQLNEDWTLEEAESRGEFTTVFRNRSEEEGGHRFETSADEFVDHIDKLLSSDHSNDQAVVELATVYERHPHQIKNWPELVAVLNMHKDAVIKIIRYHYTKELYYHAMTRSAMVSAALISAGVSWLELASMLEENKHKIIKGLLQLVKDDADDYATKQIQALRYIHINWPELAIINKSISIENKSLNEAVSYYSKKELDYIAKMALEQNDPEYAWGYLHTIGVPAVDVPDVKEFLDKNKRHFIENLLKLVKLGDAYSISVVKYKTDQLKNQGFEWPELAIIKKSLGSNIKESREITATDLGDATDQQLRNAARLATRLVHKMNMGYTFAISNTLGDMRSYMIDNDTQRLVFNAVKPEMAEYITYMVNKTSDSTLPERLVIDALDTTLHAIFLMKQIDVDTTELDNLIESKKLQIVRAILLALKNGDPTAVTVELTGVLSSLEELGYDWPEIEIIRKSVKSSRKRLRENDIDTIYKDIDTENTKLNVSQQMGIAKLRDLLARGKLANGSMAAFMIHLKYLNLNDAQKAKVYPQLERDFAAFITRRIKKKEISIVLDVLGGLVLNDIDCPNVVAVVNKHKPEVLKNLLAGIRTHYKQVGKLVNEIVDKNILDWPELDIIMKSINSLQLKEAELLNKPTPTVEELAAKHNCTPQDVLIELRKGVAIEKEHTDRLELAREIAMDHLNEDLYYYEKLKKVENKNV
jgi:hypothetical protein